MQLSTAHNNYASLNHQATPKKKKKKSAQTQNLAAPDLTSHQHIIAPFCTNKAGEIGPKTDLQRLLAASCDCV